MKKHLNFFSLVCVSAVLLVLDSSCNKCNRLTGGSEPLLGAFLGKWSLREIKNIKTGKVTPISGESLVLEPSGGSSWYSEKILRGGTQVESKSWDSYSEDCRESSISVSFKDKLQRKYWRDPKPPVKSIMEATGYVKQIGGVEDTLRYYYELR